MAVDKINGGKHGDTVGIQQAAFHGVCVYIDHGLCAIV